jgi:glycine cleavage system H lipoate-binding protein
MSFILLILTVLIFVILGLVKTDRRKAVQRTQPASVEHASQKTGERYYHPGHAWVVLASASEATVGADDFAQRVIGKLSGIQLPQLWQHVQQGEVYATLRHGDKLLPQVAPLSGVVIGINRELEQTPDLVNQSPFDQGWIVKMAPANLAMELRNLLKGIVAERWEEVVRDQLVAWFSHPTQPVLQDGGLIVEGVSDLLSDEGWQLFTEEFFPIATTTRNNNQIKN